ncbi:MAG: helix-turn-helix domain-containing protein [Proteobacteria bacterium]|nr:helix-turn-helix domain-containing protein [Pseudomonadota bacterium]
MTTPFTVVPNEVWADRRLTLEQLRVLGALLSFCTPGNLTCWPRRQQLAERSGVHIANVSSATTCLEALGWITKDGKGGHSKATRYTIHVPQTVAYPATVAESATVAQQATVADQATRMPLADSATVAPSATVAESATSTVAESATRKEETSEQTNTPLAPKQRRRRNAQTLRSFLEDCRQQNIKPIDGDDPIFDYAEKVGISEEMLVAAWAEFKAQFLGRDSTQKDWRAHYRNAVKRNWFNLWYLKEGENARWTTAGEQARRAAA